MMNQLIDIMFETDKAGNRDYRHITTTGITIIVLIILIILLGVGLLLLTQHDWNPIQYIDTVSPRRYRY